MNAYLIDTDVLIDHLRGVDKAYRFMQEIESRESIIFYSVISKAEIYSEIMPEEEESVASLFEAMEEVPVDGRAAEDAGRYRKAFRASHKLLLPDALIAASAKNVGAILVTLNRKHYPMTDIEIQIPYNMHLSLKSLNTGIPFSIILLLLSLRIPILGNPCLK